MPDPADTIDQHEDATRADEGSRMILASIPIEWEIMSDEDAAGPI